MGQETAIRAPYPYFPYIIVRAKVLQNYQESGLVDDIWVKRYGQNSKDPVAAYGASLYYAFKGDFEKALEIARVNPSPYRNLFLGEILISATGFPKPSIRSRMSVKRSAVITLPGLTKAWAAPTLLSLHIPP